MSDVIPIWRGLEASRAALLAHRQPDAGELTRAEAETLSRLFDDAPTFEQAITRILAQVRDGGDRALREICAAIDGAAPDQFKVSEAEFAAARDSVPPDLLNSLQVAADRVRSYHELQLQHAAKSFSQDGLGQVVRPIASVGLYVPGTAAVYPSSVLHTAIPAIVAGVEQVAIASPGSAGRRWARDRLAVETGRRGHRGRARCLQGGRSAGDRGAGVRHRNDPRR